MYLLSTSVLLISLSLKIALVEIDRGNKRLAKSSLLLSKIRLPIKLANVL